MPYLVCSKTEAMSALDSNFNWRHWFDRWEAMQNCYTPHRLHRFDLMIERIGLPRASEVCILDLGCGPGSLAFRALQYYPNAHVVAVEWNSILIKMGEAINGSSAHVKFLSADIRARGWWTTYEEAFDVVLSATALHWLNATHLAKTYQRIYTILKPHAWFMNSDHMAADLPEEQNLYRQILKAEQRAAFRTAGADDWDGFWRRLNRDLAEKGLGELSSEVKLWEGNDDGLPRQFHIETLQQCGFKQISFLWQYLGEAVIGARKP